jgi:hypothetical protein
MSWGTGLATAVTLLARGDEGSASADICWVDDNTESGSPFWERNKFGFYYL